MGRDVSNRQPDVAPELEALDAIFRLPGGHSEGDRYDECDRVAEHVIAEGDQNAGLVSQRRCGDETAAPVRRQRTSLAYTLIHHSTRRCSAWMRSRPYRPWIAS